MKGLCRFLGESRVSDPRPGKVPTPPPPEYIKKGGQSTHTHTHACTPPPPPKKKKTTIYIYICIVFICFLKVRIEPAHVDRGHCISRSGMARFKVKHPSNDNVKVHHTHIHIYKYYIYICIVHKCMYCILYSHRLLLGNWLFANAGFLQK